MDCHWKAWTPATTREKALRVALPLLEKVGGDEASLQIEPYPKTGGHVLSFAVRIDERAWADAVVAVLTTAQSVGHSWNVMGRIDERLDLITNHVSIVGVSTLSCWIERGKL